MRNDSYFFRQPSLTQVKPVGNTLRVTGEGTITVAPDQAIIILGSTSENKSVSQAQQENAAVIRKIISAITNLGVPESAIQTVTYRVEPQYDYVEGRQVFRNYLVTHLLRITLDQIELTGRIVDSAVASGANVIQSFQFSLKDESAARNRALVLAVQNAQGKARAIANSLSVNLNETPFKIKELLPAAGPIPRQYAVETSATPIQTGMLSITAVIEAEFSYA
jgi:uncharacterized protein YggE